MELFSPPWQLSCESKHIAGCTRLRCFEAGRVSLVDRCQTDADFTVLALYMVHPSCVYPTKPPSCRQQLLPDSWRGSGLLGCFGTAPRCSWLWAWSFPHEAAAHKRRAASPGTDTTRAWPHPAPHSVGWSLLHPTRLWGHAHWKPSSHLYK